MNGRFEIYWRGEYRGAVHTISKAIRFARVFGELAEVVDNTTDELVWEPTEPWRWQYA